MNKKNMKRVMQSIILLMQQKKILKFVEGVKLLKMMLVLFLFVSITLTIFSACMPLEKKVDGIPFFASPVVQLSNKEISSGEEIKQFIDVPNELVEWLYLDGNELESLEEDTFSAYTNLTFLSLRSNSINTLAFNALEGLTKLKVLDIRGNDIGGLPESLLTSNTELVSLDLSQNSLSNLPNNFGESTLQITNISLAENQLSELPINFLSNNALLQELKLDDNKLAMLSANNIAASNLALISLRRNEITNIEEQAFASENLQHIYFTSNMLNSVPKNIFNEKAPVTVLDLSANNITAIGEDDFKSYTNLQYLYLNNNPLDASQLHPNALAGLENLIFVYVTLSSEENGVSLETPMFSNLKETNGYVDVCHRDYSEPDYSEPQC